MIIGVGIDQCKISRMKTLLAKLENRLAKRYFPSEVNYCCSIAHKTIARYAMLFAAKEAAAKALGTGFCRGVSLSTIEIIHLSTGQPIIKFHGAAKYRLKQFCNPNKVNAHLSISDEAGVASAIVLLEY